MPKERGAEMQPLLWREGGLLLANRSPLLRVQTKRGFHHQANFVAPRLFPAARRQRRFTAMSTMAEIATIALLYMMWKRERRRSARLSRALNVIRNRAELGDFF